MSQRGESAGAALQPQRVFEPLTDAERNCLLRLAREAIAARLENQPAPAVTSPPGRLSSPAGIFVSIHRHGALRGCIGQVASLRPLARCVMDVAISSAFSDPRFPPLQRAEFADIQIEISVLSPFEDVPADIAVERIVIGRHGLLVSQGLCRGLLLPQVAPRYGWDVGEFAREVCLKAGLSPDAWQNGARIQMFEAEIFGDGYSSSTKSPTYASRAV